DKLWWFGAYRYVNTQVRQTNFPVKPFATILKTYSVKGTYQLTQNNKLIGYYVYNTKRQPNRLDRFTLDTRTSIHLNPDDAFDQHYYPRLWKGEYNSVLSDAMFFELRAGQWGYNWTDYNYTDAPSYEDSATRLVSGAARAQYTNPRRNQVLGSLSYFKQGWGGSHNFKFGWEVFRETSTNGSFANSYNSVVHILRNGAPLEVYLLGYPQNATQGLWNTGLYVMDTWRVSDKISMNLGARFDRYQNFLSEQSHQADRFFPETVNFAAVSNVRLWNVAAPRVGVSYNVTGDGKTVIKANWGLYWNNPGTASSNPNGSWQKRYAWSDKNGNGVWDSGEEGRLISSSGGVATTSLDPNQQDPYTYDTAVYLERELIANLAVRGGYVHRIQQQFTGTINTNQPFEAFNMPTTVRDPGPDGKIGTADDGGTIAANNLAATYVGLPSVNLVTNTPGSSRYDTYEVTMTKRYSHKWSAQASYSWTKSWARRSVSTTYPFNPNSCINANADCQDETTDYSFKLNGSFDLPAGFRLSPAYRFQAGNNFGRQFIASGLNYANPTINAEPLSAERTDNVNVFDLRVDRGIKIKNYRIAPFLDLYNLSNTNSVLDITITSGSSYLRPINIVSPRIARVGVKVDW
ncbi:MAG: TonB-dependent receptor, partial [Acidobacteria bacterium]|nr:TonB-dependent receptor [Acidobacteriota bacterium]